MEKVRIAIGTTSEKKLRFLVEVLKEIGIIENVEIIPVSVSSNVSEQPITELETKKGSINRAEAALNQDHNPDLGLGIEAGYHKNKEDQYELFCYVSIVDKKGVIVSCISHKFLLPKFHHDKVESGAYLGEHVKEYYKDTNHPVKKYLGEIIDSRKLIIQDALRQCLVKYFMREEF